MNDLVKFLTSQTGVFAAILAVLALVTGVVALVQPVLARRRTNHDSRAALAITKPVLSDLSRSSNSYDLRFEVANTGGAAAVALAIRLRVLEHSASTAVEPSVTEAPLRVHQHRVKLHPDQDLYDVRARTYGPAMPPLSFAQAEVEAFVVKLVADQPQQYIVQIEVEWYDATSPSAIRTTHSTPTKVEFPERR